MHPNRRGVHQFHSDCQKYRGRPNIALVKHVTLSLQVLKCFYTNLHCPQQSFYRILWCGCRDWLPFSHISISEFDNYVGWEGLAVHPKHIWWGGGLRSAQTSQVILASLQKKTRINFVLSRLALSCWSKWKHVTHSVAPLSLPSYPYFIHQTFTAILSSSGWCLRRFLVCS